MHFLDYINKNELSKLGLVYCHFSPIIPPIKKSPESKKINFKTDMLETINGKTHQQQVMEVTCYNSTLQIDYLVVFKQIMIRQ